MSSIDSEHRISVRGVTKVYPGTVALAGVDVDFEPGQVTALLGENGAGKSTLAGILAGISAPTEGELEVGGRPYAPQSPGQAVDAGIGMIHQEMRLLPDLTVAENVVVGRWPRRGRVIDRASMRRVARENLDRLGFRGSLDQPVRELNVARQQQVEIAKALALDARFLILDEPTASLGGAETEALFETVRSLREQGVGFIYVSHRLAEIAQIADRIVVLRDGHLVATHESGDVPPRQLVEEMVGRSVDRLYPDVDPAQAETVLHVEGLTSAHGDFADIGFDVRAGEIFGIAGIVGAGRTEVVRCVAGIDALAAGTVTVAGTPLSPHRPARANDIGIVLVPEDRKGQGLVVDFSVEDNIAMANLDEGSSGGWLPPGSVRTLATRAASALGVKGRLGDPASTLSGGNQQKVVIAKWLERKPRVIILDEPTRGIDVGARAAIYEIIADLARQGAAVVVVSSDLEEVLGLAHRVMVMARGENQGVLDSGDATANSVMALATA